VSTTHVDEQGLQTLKAVWSMAELRMVGDGVFYPDVLRLRSRITTWDDWLIEFGRLGDEYEKLAQEAEARGHTITAGEHYWQAAICWHFAQFLWFDRPAEKQHALERKVALYRRGSSLLDPPAERIEIEFEGTRIPGYLRLPRDLEGRAPLAILLGGLDSTKEESYHFENACLQRGFATFSFDGPGQGEYLEQRPLAPDFERYSAAVVDHLVEHPAIDAGRIGVVGRSLGGYFAARAAAHDPRLRACVVFGALYDLSQFDSIPARTQMGFRFVTGIADPDAAKTAAQARVDLAGITHRIHQPIYILHGALDILIPVAQAQRLYDEVSSTDKTLVIVPDGIHCAHNLYHLVRRPMVDWLADRLRS
jgi:2,6-dihydroxypseudooxynicotine hydrolase